MVIVQGDHKNLVAGKSIPQKAIDRASCFCCCLQTALGDDIWLQHKLIESLVDYNDISEAARWALFYHLPQSCLHPSVKQAIDSWLVFKFL